MSDDAEDAFAAVADELRVRIIRALWAADEPLTFSELRDRVEVRDSGRFNYHLGELRGRFVEQTDDGYRLRLAGRRLVGALYSGVYTEDAAVGPVPVEGSCFECDAALEARYADELGRVECTDCGLHVLAYEIPPAFVDGREDDLPTAIDGYVRTIIRQSTDGFCPRCSGPLTGTLVDAEYGPQAVFECDRCGGEFPGLASMLAFDHPAVIAFYHDHGRNIRDIPVWELDWLSNVTWNGDDAEITVTLDGDELVVRVEDSLSVSAVQRA